MVRYLPIALILLFIVLGSIAQAQSPTTNVPFGKSCGPYNHITKQLERKHGESLYTVGTVRKRDNPSLGYIEVWKSLIGNTWSLLFINNSGKISCMILAGTDWQDGVVK